MPITNGYCTEEDLREHIKDEILPASMVERVINASSRAIDRYCGRRFWPDATPQTRTYTSVDPYLLWTDDISTTTGLVIKTDTNSDGTWATTWTSTDYQLEPTNAATEGNAYAYWRIRTIGNQLFPSSFRTSVQVTARFGWSAIPDQVNEACILKAAALLLRKDSPEGVLGFQDFGGVRVSRFDPDVVSLLSPFRRVGV